MTLRPLVILSSTLALVAACGPGGGDDAPDAPADPYGLEGATVLIEGGAAIAEALTAPEAISVTVDEAGSHVILQGELDDPRSSGRTGGAYITLGPEIEQAFSGQRIEVVVVLRGPGALNAAYSTSDVGNSGWNSLAAGPDFSAARFTYDVPEMNSGRGDFLGLVPVGGSVEISAIAIEAVDEAM